MTDSSRLRIYINDHLALVVGETDLAKRCHQNNERGELGNFLRQVIDDLQTEKNLLEAMLASLNAPPDLIKQGVAWIAEKAGRFKFNGSILRYSELSRLVELETLYLTAVERHSFWENVMAVGDRYPALAAIDFARRDQLATGHAEQFRRFRTETAQHALCL